MIPVRTLASVMWSGAVRTRPRRPGHVFRLIRALRRWDRTPAAGLVALAGSYPDEPYVIDERGVLTFAEVDRRTNALAHSLAAAGVRRGDRVALMCRNSRYFVESVIGCSKLGAVAVLLNTDFAGPQLAGVVEREDPVALIHDEEFEGLLSSVGDRRRYAAWTEGSPGRTTIEELIAAGDDRPPRPPPAPGRLLLLTSGTTGTPKGVRRAGSVPLAPLFGFLDRVPLRVRETHVVAAPMFHAFGWLNCGVSLMLGTTLVLQRRFDPERTLELIALHRAHSAPMVPVMLQRILELPDEVRARHDTSSLHALVLGGSALPGDLAVRAMDELGDVVYNLYGSTEVALASVATPEDLRTAPGTAGRPLPGTTVRILDARGAELPAGETGRVFVGSKLAAEGYSGGGGKEVVDGVMSTGDLGHLDSAGRLFIDGREDDMIVSGGENVFPGEVEDLLFNHPSICEAAVIGVDDEDFGQRLSAFVVLHGDGSLSEAEVKDHVRSSLARYKVPREVRFLEALPRNPTGKVLKGELAGSSNGR
jgi:acyl-CoA synthetase (AMP-forming)/AMP-acid ligase II